MRQEIKLTALSLTLLSAFVLSGCDKGSKSSSTDDETAALVTPQFTAPIMLHLSGDTYAAAQSAAAMHGNSPIYPPDSHTVGINLLPCRGSDDNFIYPTTFAFSASIGSYSWPRDTVELWLVKKGILDLQRYPIRHSMPEDRDYGKVSTFTCPVVSESLRQYLPPDQNSANIHNGIDVPILQRKFVEWTYRNRYETAISGSGTVKMFAGTFTYTLESTIPNAITSAVGTASVKMMLNPDTGRWETVEYQTQDPAIDLQ